MSQKCRHSLASLEGGRGTKREERRKQYLYSSLQGYDEAPLGCRRNRERQLGILHGGAVMYLLDSPSMNFCLMGWLDFKQIPEI